MDDKRTGVTGTIVSPYAILKNRENYVDWKAQVESYLESRDLLDVLQPDSEPPESGTGQIKEWKKKNAAALHAIQVACGPDVLPVIRGIALAKDAWSILAKWYNNFMESKISKGEPSVQEREDYSDLETVDVHKFEPLYKAIVKGDWRSAKNFIAKYPEGKQASITLLGETALDVAVCWGQVHIVKELVKMLTDDEFENIIEDNQLTLIRAVTGTSFPIAKSLIEKKNLANKKLGVGSAVPLVYVKLFGRDDITRYLYYHTPLKDLTEDGAKKHGVAVVAESMLYPETFDIALDLVKHCPSFTTTPSDFHINKTPLLLLATRESSFSGGRKLVFWKRWIYNCIKIEATSLIRHPTYAESEEREVGTKGQSLLQKIYGYLYGKSGIKKIYGLKLIHAQSCEFLRCSWENIKGLKDLDSEEKLNMMIEAISVAVEAGNAGFVIEAMKLIPQPIFDKELFQLAVENREAEIFSILFGLPHKGIILRTTDDKRNNLLHLASNLAPPSRIERISGAALQMQSEIQWFKEVETITRKIDTEALNEDGLTPKALFGRTHKKLMEDGEKWMKDTATSCTVAATLIITIMFAAAFSPPSSEKEGDESGTATIRDKWFLIYIASDAVSLFSSTTSALVFLGILTTRYHEEAFLKSLPTQMIIGLSTLFISIATMMICFCAGLYVILDGELWIFIPLILFASVPVSSYACLQFPTLVEMIVSTYGSGPFDPKKFQKLSKY